VFGIPHEGAVVVQGACKVRGIAERGDTAGAGRVAPVAPDFDADAIAEHVRQHNIGTSA
jgi:hypothetical protein